MSQSDGPELIYHQLKKFIGVVVSPSSGSTNLVGST